MPATSRLSGSAPPLVLFGLLLAAAASGCSGGSEGEGTTQAQQEPSGEAAQGAEAEPHTEPGQEPEPEPGPPPVVRIRTEQEVPTSVRRVVKIYVENRGREPARLSSRFRVERAEGRGFTAVDGVEGLLLRDRCGEEPPSCRTLAPGAELRPPPWRGMIGDAQCECEECGPAPAGRYRLVLESCGGAHRIESEPFTLP